MNGEFALGIIPMNSPTIPQLKIGLGGAIILETSDRAKAETALAILTAQLQKQFNLSTTQKEFGNKIFTTWQIPNNNSSVNYGWLDRDSLLFTLGDSVLESMNESSASSILKNDTFRSITRQLPERNFGYFYLNWEQLMSDIDLSVFDTYNNLDPATIQLLHSIKSIGATGTAIDSSTSQLDILVSIENIPN